MALHGYPAPPSLLTGNSTHLPDGQLFHIITFGRANMPSHGATIEPADRWAVITYLRELQRRQGIRSSPLPPEEG